jgi:hypothetical protein
MTAGEIVNKSIPENTAQNARIGAANSATAVPIAANAGWLPQLSAVADRYALL